MKLFPHFLADSVFFVLRCSMNRPGSAQKNRCIRMMHRFSYRLRVKDLYFALEVFDVFAVLVALAVFEAFSTEATSQVLLSSL